MDKDTVIAAFDSSADAQAAVDALTSAGVSRSNIKMQPESNSSLESATGTTTTHDEGGGIGGFFRSLFGMDDDYKSHHDVYAESVRRGHYVVTVHADSERELDEAINVLNRFNPVDIDQRAEHWKSQGWSGYDASAPAYGRDEIERERSSYASLSSSRGNNNAGSTKVGDTANAQRIPVIEEELQVGKRVIQRGGVRVFQRVREIPVNEQVQLREEHVNVERHPVDRPATAADFNNIKDGAAIELRESAEEAVVSKTARVVEEVVVNKEATQRTEQVKDTVRRTDVEVEQLGASGTGRNGVTGATGTAGTSVDDDEFRRHWQSTYGSSGGRYEDYGDAYRYGSTMAGSGRFKNYRWEDVEPDVRSDWESNHPGSAWDKVKDAVRYGAERVTGKRHS
jgi:uncharacterized protein (TIGR02271 family)